MVDGSGVKRRITRSDWAMKPVMPGAWRELSLADACAVIARLSAHEGRQNASDYSADLAMLHRARVLPLISLPGWVLIEVEGELADGALGCLAFALGPKGYVVPMDWTGRPLQFLIHEAFSWPLTGDAAVEYALLYAGVMSNKGQRFRPFGAVDDVDFAAAATAAELAAFSGAVQPIRVDMAEGRALVTLNMVYGGGLYRSRFELSPGGGISLVDDQFQVDSCVRLEVLRGAFRVLLPFAIPPVPESGDF